MRYLVLPVKDCPQEEEINWEIVDLQIAPGTGESWGSTSCPAIYGSACMPSQCEMCEYNDGETPVPLKVKSVEVYSKERAKELGLA